MYNRIFLPTMIRKLLRIPRSCFLVLLFAALLYQIIHGYWHYFPKNGLTLDVEVPIILWWTDFAGEEGGVKTCPKNQCYFTQNRSLLSNSNIKAVLFYGSHFKATDLPIPRDPEVQWVLLHEESPRNNLILTHEPVITLFNQSATFKRSSNFALTSLHLDSLESLISKRYFVPLKNKNELLSELSPVLYIQSDCDTMSERDIYVQKLMEFINIDSYGACLNNKKIPESLANPLEDMKKELFLHFVARYKFTLSFENALCDDYITEKLWRPLAVGSIPIYLGSVSVRDWLPNENSAILAADFNSPEDLASHLHLLNSDDELYSSHLQHKSEGIISNRKLMHEMENRLWCQEDFVEKFECFICDSLNQNSVSNFVSRDHLSCPPPVSPFTFTANRNSWWLMHWHDSKTEANVLRKLIEQRTVFTPENFYDIVFRHSENVKNNVEGSPEYIMP